MIIRPYSEFDTVAELAPTAANFPSLKHFWNCEEGVLDTAIHDIVGGASITIAAGDVIRGGFGIVPQDIIASAVPTTPILSPDTGACLLLSCAIATNTVFTYGSGIATGIVLGSSASGMKVANAGNVKTAGTPPTVHATDIYGRALAISNSGGALQTAYSLQTNVAGVNTALASVDLTAVTAISSIPEVTQTVSFSVAQIYGVAMFIFANGLPADYLAAVAWMAKQWSIGNKVIYPGWKDVL